MQGDSQGQAPLRSCHSRLRRFVSFSDNFAMSSAMH